MAKQEDGTPIAPALDPEFDADEFVIEVGYIRYGYLYKSKIIRSKHSKLIFSKAIEARINPWISGANLYFSSAN